MRSLPIQKESLEQIKSGITKKMEIVKEGWNTWEFLCLIMIPFFIFYIFSSFPVPLLTDGEEYTPDRQEYYYHSSINHSSEDNIEFEIRCTPTSDYANTDGYFRCYFQFYNLSQDRPARLSESEVNEIKNRVDIEYYWLESNVGNNETEPNYIVIHDEYVHNEGDYYTIHGDRLIRTPKTSGQYRLQIRYLNDFERVFTGTDSIRIYSDAQIASFDHREVTTPLEQLVVVALLLSVFRLSVTLSDRVKKKVNQRNQSNWKR